MNNVILKTTLALAWKLLVLYSLYILLRGHNEPGGGFIGGLLLALGIIIRDNNAVTERLSTKIKDNFERFLGCLLLFFLLIIVFPVFLGEQMLTGIWTSLWVPIAGKFSSVLLFDVMVYFIVAFSAVYANAALSSLIPLSIPSGDKD